MRVVDLASAALRRLDPERAHGMALTVLALGARAKLPPRPRHDPRLGCEVMGLHFPTPIGLAAGFDKDAVAVGAYERVGFGFAEIGTLTPRPQPGNRRPRLFRLPEERAVINRMGFNNRGIEAAVARLRAARAAGLGIPIGLNVGINKESADPERDYPALVAAAATVADYVVINVSSPNTPGLRDLQSETRLRSILDAVGRVMPPATRLLVKIAPDLANEAITSLVRALMDGPSRGVIVTNTTVARPPGLRGAHAGQAGGLSGAPLARRALDVLDLAVAARGGASPFIVVACGGIEHGRDVARRLDAGADLVQLYTGFAYGGPALLARLERDMLEGTR